MTLLDHGQPADTTQQHHTGLIAVLAVLAVALLAVGGWLIVDRQRQQSSTEQQPLSIEQQRVAIMEAVTAHRDALTAPDDDGDQAAILTTLTDDATYVFDDSGVVLQGVGYAGAAAGGELTFTGAPVFSGGLQVAIPIDREPPSGVSVGGAPATPRDGTYVFTLREVDGQLKIATIVFEEP